MRACTLFLAAALAANAQGVNFYSLEREASLGGKMTAEFLKTTTPTAYDKTNEPYE